MTALLLDTHAWLWLAAGSPRLARHARKLERAAAAGELLLASVSLYEATQIGLETERGERRGQRAVVMRPTVAQWIRDAVSATRISVASLTAETALDAAMLHSLHGDPFDRCIVATAISLGAHLVTADTLLLDFAKATKLAVLAL